MVDPLIEIAHRGAPRRALENTLQSFEMAKDAGARVFELDVWLSCDGHPVVLHDPTLKRLARRHDKVSSMTLEQLQAVGLTGGYRIPPLERVLEALCEPGLKAYQYRAGKPPPSGGG